MIDIEDVKKTRESFQEKRTSSDSASRHHAKIMQQLHDLGLKPNPIQQIVVDDELHKDFSKQFDKNPDNETQRDYFY